MRTIFNKYLLVVGLGTALVTSTGCFKHLGDYGTMNNNPNATTAPIPSALLTNALNGLNTGVWDQGGFRTTNGLYAQYFSETQYTDASRYARTTINFDGFYSGVIEDLQNIINYNSDPATAATAAAFGSNKNQIAIARILKAFYFWQITDTWGDIPYTQALKGKGDIPYDTQDVIYKDLLKELKEAVAQFDAGATVQGDIMYSGNTSKWKKFANSMRLMIALRMSKADAATGKAEFTAALADPAGTISSSSDNGGLAAPGGTYQNPFYNYYVVVQRKDYAVSKTVTDALTNMNDERINAYGSSNVGFPFGLTRADAVTFANNNVNYARILEPSRRTETSPTYLITSEEVKLARAEAAAIGWTTEVAAALYADAIKDSWTRWGVYDATKYAAYMLQPSVALTGVGDVAKIAMQEWLSAYPDGTQGFSIWRKTGVPALVPSPGLTSIPRRLSYGSNEPQLNPTNYTTAAARYTDATGPDSQYGKVWWDK